MFIWLLIKEIINSYSRIEDEDDFILQFRPDSSVKLLEEVDSELM
jgi:hypothetical protein